MPATTLRTLTDRQAAVLVYLAEFHAEHGYAPAVRDVARYFEISDNGALHHIMALQAKEYVTREVGVCRSICVVQKREPNTIR